MDDLISRQAAIEKLKRNKSLFCKNRVESQMLSITDKSRVDEIDTCIAELLNLPSAQQWIPVTERLPESYTDVLVWFEYYRYGDYNRLYQMHGIGTYSKEYDSWIINHETGWRKLRVFAWMPLPEPWEGEEHGASRTMLPKKSLC